MSATILTPASVVCTTSLADLFSNVATGKVRKINVRAANVGAAAANLDLTLYNGTTTVYRCKNYPVGYNDTTAAPDVESGLVIPAGWRIQVKASAGSNIEVSYDGVEADATDFV